MQMKRKINGVVLKRVIGGGWSAHLNGIGFEFKKQEGIFPWFVTYRFPGLPVHKLTCIETLTEALEFAKRISFEIKELQ